MRRLPAISAHRNARMGPFVGHSRHQTSLGSYSTEVGRHVTCCLLVETSEAVENIESILRVPGIDLVVVAQFDLSGALGLEGQFESPVFIEAVDKIERAAAQSGLPLGAAALSRDQSSSLIAKGYSALFHGFDVLMLKEQIAQFATWD